MFTFTLILVLGVILYFGGRFFLKNKDARKALSVQLKSDTAKLGGSIKKKFSEVKDKI